MNENVSSTLVFFGTPVFAITSLQALIQSGRTVKLVVAQPAKKAGRGLQRSISPVEEYAHNQGLPIATPKKLRDPAFLEQLKKTGAKVFVVVAYGRILPEELLAIPNFILNVHASLLPRWRGAAPIERSILAADTLTGISIMKLVQELDAGDLLLQKEASIGNQTAGELRARLSELGAKALVEGLDQLDQGRAKFTPQDQQRVTYAPPIRTEEAKIDWNKPVQEICNQVRAFNPMPGAFTIDRGQRMKIHESQATEESCTHVPAGTLRVEQNRLWIATSDRWLEILKVQREGKSILPVSNFLTGYRIGPTSAWGV